jgi:hypothetical protein
MIENNVTYEIAKWLKEKGFDVDCRSKFLRGEIEYNGIHNPFFAEPKEDIVERPEQWQVVEWLRVNHGIWVWVRPYKDHAADNNDPIQHQMNVYKNGVTVSKEFNSHEEAYSASFDYIKDNRIF